MEAGLLAAADRANLTSSIRPIKPPAISGGDKSQNGSTNSPSVQVNLSDTGRQLSIESQQKNSVQASAESAESRPTRLTEQQLNTQVSSVGEQNTILNPNEATDQSLANSTQASPVYTNERAEQSSNPDTQTNSSVNAENSSTAIAPQQPVRSNQNASVVTQYNVTPDAVIGQSISIQA